MRARLANASSAANEPPRNKLPPDAQRMRTWALGQLGHVAGAVNPVEHEELATLRAARATVLHYCTVGSHISPCRCKHRFSGLLALAGGVIAGLVYAFFPDRGSGRAGPR
jgi:hypothetical protein